MNKKSKSIKIAVVENERLIRNWVADMINKFENCKVIIQASDGVELLDMINKSTLPDLVLLDLNMPRMNGYDTAKELSEKFPQIGVLVISSFQPHEALLQLIKSNLKGIVSKNIDPSDLNHVINHIIKTDHCYFSNPMVDKLKNFNIVGKDGEMNAEKYKLTEEEFFAFKMSATELAYKEIAEIMKIGERSLATIISRLFEKFDVKNRIGLAKIAFRNGLVDF